MYLRSNAKIYNRSARRFIEVPYTLHCKTAHHINAYITTNSQHTSDHDTLRLKHFPARALRTSDISTCDLLLLLLLCYILFSFLTLCTLLPSWGHGYTNSFFQTHGHCIHPKHVYIRDAFIPGNMYSEHSEQNTTNHHYKPYSTHTHSRHSIIWHDDDISFRSPPDSC
jgi:hypothetical protein